MKILLLTDTLRVPQFAPHERAMVFSWRGRPNMPTIYTARLFQGSQPAFRRGCWYYARRTGSHGRASAIARIPASLGLLVAAVTSVPCMDLARAPSTLVISGKGEQ
jgi:hypothetical protein